MIRTRTITFAALIPIMLALSFNLYAQNPKDIKMTFKVENGSLELVNNRLLTSKSDCKRDDHPGCYHVPAGQSGRFRLTLSGGDSACRREDDWKFHSVVLGGEAPATQPGSKPTTWGNISPDAASDFDADRSTGAINIVPDGKKRIEFEDKNRYAFSIWYKVVVEQCGSGNQLVYDPRIDNRG